MKMARRPACSRIPYISAGNAHVYEIDYCTAFGPCSACGRTPIHFVSTVCGEHNTRQRVETTREARLPDAHVCDTCLVSNTTARKLLSLLLFLLIPCLEGQLLPSIYCMKGNAYINELNPDLVGSACQCCIIDGAINLHQVKALHLVLTYSAGTVTVGMYISPFEAITLAQSRFRPE